MKIISVLVLMSLSGLGVQAQQSPYEINGEVKNLPAKWVYIRTMKKNAEGKLYWPLIDSARVVNGKFKLHKDTILQDPAWASGLSYKDTISNKYIEFSFINPLKKEGEMGSKHGNFILENAKQTVTGEGAVLRLTGSKETDYNMKYSLMFTPSLRGINKRIDSLQALSRDSEYQAAIAERKAIVGKYKDEFMTMVKENPSTWMAVLNVYQNAAAFSPEDLEAMVAVFDERLMATSKGKALDTHIKQSKLLLQNKSFPDFNYVDSGNKKFQLGQLKGKKGTLVVFWASWCGPCRAEIPELKAFYQFYKEKGISLISISTDQNIGDWKKALEKEKMPWTNLANLPGNAKEINAKYNIQAIPAMFLLDKDDKIVLADPNDFDIVVKKTDELIKGI